MLDNSQTFAQGLVFGHVLAPERLLRCRRRHLSQGQSKSCQTLGRCTTWPALHNSGLWQQLDASRVLSVSLNTVLGSSGVRAGTVDVDRPLLKCNLTLRRLRWSCRSVTTRL